MPTTEAQKKFALFIATKEVQAWLSEFPVEGTKATYSSALYRYWSESLSKKFSTLWDWITEVKRQRKSDEMTTRKAWALDVLTYMKARTGLGNRPMATASKELLSSAVKSFLRALADEEIDYDFKIAYTIEEQRAKKDKPSDAAIQSLSVTVQTLTGYLAQAQNIKLQAATVDELAKQSRRTRWLAISTTVLAAATAMLAFLTNLKP